MNQPLRHVSRENAQRGRENIEAKLQLLRSCLLANFKETADRLPKTRRQFNLWAVDADALGRGLPPSRILANANDTLRKNASSLIKLDDLLEKVKQRGESAWQISRESRVGALSNRLQQSEILKKIAEREVGRLVQELENARTENNKLRASLDSQASYAKERISDLRTEVGALKARNAELTAALRKVTRLS